LFLVMAVCCVLLHVPETISFAILFLIVIVKSDWVCPVPGLLSDPGGNLATPGRNDGIELNHPSLAVLRTT